MCIGYLAILYVILRVISAQDYFVDSSHSLALDHSIKSKTAPTQFKKPAQHSFETVRTIPYGKKPLAVPLFLMISGILNSVPDVVWPYLCLLRMRNLGGAPSEDEMLG